MASDNTTIELGDISITVGTYQHATKGERKTRRHIGKLMETQYADGGRSRWIKLNQEVLSPSLLIMARPFSQKGSDTLLLDVFDPQPRNGEKAPADKPPDDVPY